MSKARATFGCNSFKLLEVAEISMRTHSCKLVSVVAIALCGGSVAGAQEKAAFFLPQDAQLVDDITVVGTSERRLSAGLSRLTVPDSDTTYYVVDEVNALRGDLVEAFSDIWRNDSDISIAYDQYRSEFIHLRVRDDVQDARYIRVEPALLFQISEFFEVAGDLNGGGSIEFTEYQISIADCFGLDAAVERMESLLQASMRSIGTPPESSDGVTMDGRSYRLDLRLGWLLRGTFGVGENSGPLFDAVHSIRTIISECSMTLEPEISLRDF